MCVAKVSIETIETFKPCYYQSSVRASAENKIRYLCTFSSIKIPRSIALFVTLKTETWTSALVLIED